MRATATGRVRPGEHDRRSRADEVEQRRGEDRAGADRRQHDALEHAEQAPDHPRRRRPLQQGDRGDVDDGVARADAGEQNQDEHGAPGDSDEGDPDPPHQHPERERERQAPPGGQRRGRHAAEDAADAERRVEVAHSGVADVEHLQREHHREHRHRARHQRLQGVHTHDHGQKRRRQERPHPAGDRVQEPLAGLLRAPCSARPDSAGGSGTSATRPADHASTTAQAAKLSVEPPAASSRPPIPGPTKMAALSIGGRDRVCGRQLLGSAGERGRRAPPGPGRNAVLTAAITQARA